MEINQMLELQQVTEQGALTRGGALAGAVVGAAFGAPTLGAAIGSTVGTFATNFIPQHSTVRGSVAGINFVNLNIKPYMLKIVVPDAASRQNISDYYIRFGCKTNRTERLSRNFASYFNNNIGGGYIKGTLHPAYQNLPPHIFTQINAIFQKGFHFSHVRG